MAFDETMYMLENILEKTTNDYSKFEKMNRRKMLPSGLGESQ